MKFNKGFNWGRFVYFVIIVFLAIPFLLSLFVPLVLPELDISFIDKTISGVSLILTIVGTIVGLVTFNSNKEDAERQNRTDDIVTKLDVIASKLEKEVSKINGDSESLGQDNINSIKQISANGNVSINYSFTDTTIEKSKTFFKSSDSSGENGEITHNNQSN